MQVTLAPVRSVISPTCNKRIAYIPWHDGIYLGPIVQEGHTTFPTYPHFSYILDPVLSLKGVWIQTWSLQNIFYALGASV